MSKSCSEPIIDRKHQVRIVGPSSGIAIRRWTCHQLAPSSCAASNRSVGTPCRPARKSRIARPEVLPGEHHEHRRERQVRRPQEALVGRREPDGADEAVDDAGLRLQQLVPDHAGDHLGHDVRHEHDRPEQPTAVDVAVEQQRHGQTQRQLDQDRGEHDDEVVRHRAGEDLVGQHVAVVVDPDEVVHRAEALPAVERHPHRRDDRPDDEDRHQRQRRRHEERDLQALPPSRPDGPGGHPALLAPGGPSERCGRRGGGDALICHGQLTSPVTSRRPRPAASRRRRPAGTPRRRTAARSRRSWPRRPTRRRRCRSTAGRTARRRGP